jgi:hypothetical protein
MGAGLVRVGVTSAFLVSGVLKPLTYRPGEPLSSSTDNSNHVSKPHLVRIIISPYFAFSGPH